MLPTHPEVSARRRRRGLSPLRISLAIAAIGTILALILAATSCHGHVIRSRNLPTGMPDFDFKRPPCAPGSMPDADPDDVLVRYLGVSGLYIRWRGTAILTAPFFSRYPGRHVPFGKVKPDLAAIRSGMAGLPETPIQAVLVGHSHFDHLADLPAVLRMSAPGADVYLNSSGKNMLDGAPNVPNTFIDVGPITGQWIQLRDDHGADLPLRFMAIPSQHAPQAKFFRFADGTVNKEWKGLEGRRLRSMQGGQTHSYLIDLLHDDDSVAFRMHYQDAASTPAEGFPPDDTLDTRGVDLSVVCMPSYWNAPGYPVELLKKVRARHVLMTHYEDFFRSTNKKQRFVALLTDKRANGLIEMVRETLGQKNLIGPSSDVCGPGGDAWTMPLAGEWLRFETDAPGP